MNRKPLVLVVDDEASHLKLTELLLHKAGCDTVTAAGGQEALPILRACTPDLIVMDIHLPGLSGIDLCGRIRGVARLREVPIILITSQLSPEVEALAKWEGVTQVLEKPLRMAMFQELVGQLLKHPVPRDVVAA